MRVRTPASPSIRVFQIILIVAVSLISFAALTLPIGLRPITQSLTEGDVATVTVAAQGDLEYISEIRTEEARKAAESAVAPVYSLPDPAIARRQIERLTTAMQYITSVRDNAEMTVEEKKSELVALSDVRLKLETIDYLLAISDARWQIVQSVALRVLEQVMRRAILEDAVESVQDGVPAL